MVKKGMSQFNAWNEKPIPNISHRTVQSVLGKKGITINGSTECSDGGGSSCNCGGGCNGSCGAGDP